MTTRIPSSKDKNRPGATRWHRFKFRGLGWFVKKVLLFNDEGHSDALYLCNPDWIEGDGGETGLYGSREDPVDRPIAVVPPINNSLLMFECTPYSYHSFLSNGRSPRNSVIVWLHREKVEVLSRWEKPRLKAAPGQASCCESRVSRETFRKLWEWRNSIRRNRAPWQS
jgi:2OG-Fe(II) oxygenase superfamily